MARNQSERFSWPRPMSQSEVRKRLTSVNVGDKFRVWYQAEWAWKQEEIDGYKTLVMDDIEIDGPDLEAAISRTPLDYEVVRAPHPSNWVGEVVLLRTGIRYDFVFKETGIRAIEWI